jgi:hypothetical protein
MKAAISERDPFAHGRVGDQQQVGRQKHPVADQIAVDSEPAGSRQLTNE